MLPSIRQQLDHQYDKRIDLEAIDLRWGVPASANRSARGKSWRFYMQQISQCTAVEHCLREAMSADVLVALLGHRYGYRPPQEHLLALAAAQPDEFEVRDDIFHCIISCVVAVAKRHRGRTNVDH